MISHWLRVERFGKCCALVHACTEFSQVAGGGLVGGDGAAQYLSKCLKLASN